jgi:hypothetical protein
MAKIPKCDNCGVLHTVQNPVTEKSHDCIYLTNGDINKPGYLGITITPAAHGKSNNYETHDMCKNCLDDIIRSRFGSTRALAQHVKIVNSEKPRRKT